MIRQTLKRNEKIKALVALAKGDKSLLIEMQPEKPLFVNYKQIGENKYQLEDSGLVLTLQEIDAYSKQLLESRQPQFLEEI